MPFAKPYNYVDGSVLSATGQDSNETAAKCYINNKIAPGDIAGSTFDFDSIQKGELDPITNHYRFATGDIYGKALPNEPLDRSYFTSNVKSVNQTGNDITVWIPTYETATTFELEATATVMITFGGTYISNSNVEQAHGRWDSKCLLRYNDGTSWQNLDGTRAYTFEENTAAAAGTRNPAFHGAYLVSTATMSAVSFTLLHSPSTTSEFTYKIRCKSSGGTLYLNRSGTDTDNSAWMRGVSTITLQEIAA